jgi:hypothetical protein
MEILYTVDLATEDIKFIFCWLNEGRILIYLYLVLNNE